MKLIDIILKEQISRERFIQQLIKSLRKISPEARKRVLDDMIRLQTSILCKEEGVCSIKDIGRPTVRKVLDLLADFVEHPMQSNIQWAITKGKKADYNEVRKGLRHIMEFAAKEYKETNDREFIDMFLKTLKSNQDGLVKMAAPIKYQSKTPGSRLVGKQKQDSIKTSNKGFVKEHTIPTAVVYEALKQSVLNDNVNEMFDVIMKDYFQVNLNTDDDKKLNDAGFNSSMPPGWKFGDDPWARYKAAGIDVANTIEKI